MKIKFNEMKDVQRFVSKCSMFEDDIVLLSGRYVVDGKSLLGILSLDLSKPVDLKIDTDDISTKHVFTEYMVEFSA